ncbi:LysE family transporter [uncultured Hoeflea sp.]|uniref:LysE family translocator n=1 Tax=uncultured Hoeflea sp. TaxID=538666 RepID=UPI0030DC76B6|tara:strand:- start:1984 stop:2577 length:594 start_codon:yes stop_codon:yes gene_type:complete
MRSGLVVLLLAALPLMGSPGPATLSTAAIGSAFGIAKGVKYLVGIIAGTTTVLGLIATGVTGVILTQPALVNAITVLAIGYILYLAYKIATAPALSIANKTSKAPSFLSGYLLAVANPKAFAAIGAVYSGSVLIPGDVLLDAAFKLIALTLVIIAVNSAWLLFGSALSSVLSDPKKGRIANVIFALLLIGSVVLAVI